LPAGEEPIAAPIITNIGIETSVKSFKPAQFEGADAKDVTFPAGPNNSMTLKGQQFLSGFAFPNFYFHAATTHGILRHNGVEIGKRDFLGV